MSFKNKNYAGSIYKEDNEWIVYICDFNARTFKRDWFKYFEHKSAAIRYYSQYSNGAKQ